MLHDVIYYKSIATKTMWFKNRMIEKHKESRSWALLAWSGDFNIDTKAILKVEWDVFSTTYAGITRYPYGKKCYSLPPTIYKNLRKIIHTPKNKAIFITSFGGNHMENIFMFQVQI